MIFSNNHNNLWNTILLTSFNIPNKASIIGANINSAN